jgi:hypothetical protein
MAALILTRWAKRRLDRMKELNQDQILMRVSIVNSDEGPNIDENVSDFGVGSEILREIKNNAESRFVPYKSFGEP